MSAHRCVLAGRPVECLDDGSFARLRDRDGIPDPWSPAFAASVPFLRLGFKGCNPAISIPTAQRSKDGRYQVLLLSRAEHATLALLPAKGFAEHLLSGSLLAPVYAHFTLADGAPEAFAVVVADGPRCRTNGVDDDGIDDGIGFRGSAGVGIGGGAGLRYDEVLEVGGGRALVRHGAAMLTPQPSSLSSDRDCSLSRDMSSDCDGGDPSSSAPSAAAASAAAAAAHETHARVKRHAPAARVPWLRDAPGQRALSDLVRRDAAW